MFTPVLAYLVLQRYNLWKNGENVKTYTSKYSLMPTQLLLKGVFSTKQMKGTTLKKYSLRYFMAHAQLIS